uniref:VWA-Hint protein Vwaint domain-containing protein n=1 Tax=Hordeum vulgare subsp. vulgare TaxID=112509 RepID=A0A8I7B840_HORVV
MSGRKKVPRLAAPPPTPQAQAGLYQDDEPLWHLIGRIAGARHFHQATSLTTALHLAAPPPTAYAQVQVGAYHDDEPLERCAAAGAQAQAPAADGGLVLKTQCEFPALGRGASRDKFAVLVHVRAPADVASMNVGMYWNGRTSFLPPPNRTANDYMTLVPLLFTHADTRPGPVHTFGFGADNDALAMHTIAEATGGTFSFIENQAAIQDSFAQCIGGILSVAVQEARIAVTCLHRGVRVQGIQSGCYGNHVGDDGRAASIDEERRFLVLVHVPRARPVESVTRLVKVSCTYKVAATGQAAQAAAPAAVIQRLLELELTEAPPPSIDVERERVRLAATQDITAARAAAEGGQHAGAARILDSRLKAMERSAPGAAGDPTCEAIKEELRDLSSRVGNLREYQKTGRARLLAGMSSHAQQRASASTSTKARAYLTPKMEEMVKVSRKQSRKRGGSQQPWSQLKQIKQDVSGDF